MKENNKSLQEELKNLKLEKYVKFLGQREDVNELYNAMDVFLLPSLYEGLPVVGVEAQANGLLCIFSDDMTKETKVLDSTKFMSLCKTAQEWVETILNDVKTYKKHDAKEEVSMFGFNIEKETEKLERKYYEYLGD